MNKVNEFMLVASELKKRGMSDEQLARLFTSQFLGKSLKLGNEPDNEISRGDTVYVVATCADTLKRADGSCYFREFGGCPYQESGALNYCGEREDALAIFQSVVENETEQGLYIRGLSFGIAGESAPTPQAR